MVSHQRNFSQACSTVIAIVAMHAGHSELKIKLFAFSVGKLFG